ncbi:MAG: DUF481 domain-containing protein [Proteobacteria bacterium]|nr:DUF481 domain-containing protein [Pseudomonadota bacterium]
MCRVFATITVFVVGFPAVAGAQKDPNFVAPTKDKKAANSVEWSASAQAGFALSTGNTEQTLLSAGARVSRKKGFNKLQFGASAQYARSTTVQAVDSNDDNTADTLVENTQTTAQSWALDARYDRFLTKYNSLYITALVSGDEPAGKDFVGGGQTGYSRQLYKDDTHQVVGEVGYDFSYENLVAGDGVSIHSGRLFAGYTGKLTETTGITLSVETLFNVNTLNIEVPQMSDSGGAQASPFDDTRATVKGGLTTVLFKDISLNIGFTAKYDRFPAFLSISNVPKRADKFDATTKASLIVSFL